MKKQIDVLKNPGIEGVLGVPPLEDMLTDLDFIVTQKKDFRLAMEMRKTIRELYPDAKV